MWTIIRKTLVLPTPSRTPIKLHPLEVMLSPLRTICPPWRQTCANGWCFASSLLPERTVFGRARQRCPPIVRRDLAFMRWYVQVGISTKRINLNICKLTFTAKLMRVPGMGLKTKLPKFTSIGSFMWHANLYSAGLMTRISALKPYIVNLSVPISSSPCTLRARYVVKTSRWS